MYHVHNFHFRRKAGIKTNIASCQNVNEVARLANIWTALTIKWCYLDLTLLQHHQTIVSLASHQEQQGLRARCSKLEGNVGTTLGIL